MAIEVFGSFQSKDEAIKEVDKLSLGGIPSNHITLFTVQESADELVKETDGMVENVDEDHDDNLLSKLKKIFVKISDTDKSLHDELKKAGLSEEQATRYAEEVRKGTILVLADNQVKMGHHSANVGEDAFEVPANDAKKLNE